MGILVLGMHRSGTSALAGALEAMGFEVGPDDDLMPADIGNPEGYFELLSVVRANDDLLAHFGGRWDSPPEFQPNWTSDDAALEFVQKGRADVRRLFASDRYLLKDPRISLLLPLWRQITNDGCAVVIVRDPLEVAASLHRRNGLPTLTGLALWATYNRATFRDLQGARVHVCNYAELIENPRDVLGAIAASLREWGEVGEDLDLTRAFASIHPELRRNKIVDAEIATEALPVEINELMKLAMDQRGRHDSFAMVNGLKPSWWEGSLLEERRLLLQWALGEISQLQIHNTNLVRENEILLERGDAALDELERVRAENERLIQRLPGPLLGRLTKLTRRP
ncbi:MAG TPA: hypothetical protein VMU68_10235 [Acidimicrobiales bacterium]|nr:hypothetical protein [Acidimicrobiales bacterium]